MKKHKNNKVATQASKISDFFAKVPNNTTKNETGSNKRKLLDAGQPPGPAVLNSVTNLPQKCEQQISPTRKKPKQDENYFSHKSVNGVNNRNHFEVVTPKKRLKPSTSMKTPTPKKDRTPQSSKKSTPKKLFEKSPKKLEEFNVQLFDAFVQISPSRSNKKFTFSHTTSPGISKRYSPVKTNNKTTPLKSSGTPLEASKFETKLSHLNCGNEVKKEMNGDHKIKTEIKLEIDSALEDEFDNSLNFEDDYHTLNLNEPQFCTVLEVHEWNEKVVLKLKSSKDDSEGICNIEEFWASCNHFRPYDKVCILAEKINNKWLVNNSKGFLVYEPDLLIPCTSVVASLFCKRKTVLSDRFRGFESGNRIMLIGVLTHSLLQQALKNKLKSDYEIRTLLKAILRSKDTVKKLYENNLSCDDIEREIEIFVPKLVTFISEYVKCDSRPESSNWQGKICDINDIEETLWCPELGIKGKIDVTLQSNTGTMPLELKTGRATVSFEHRGQVVLYIMMMNKLGYNVSSGLLLYLREGTLKEVKATSQEKRDVMILRNELAYFLSRNFSNTSGDLKKAIDLPEPLNDSRICLKCPYNIICTSYLKYEDHDTSKNKCIEDVQKKVTSHLTQSHLDYFLLWTNLLTMEAEENKFSKAIQQIYTLPPKTRESRGRSIINLKVMTVGEEQNGLYEHTFEKDNSHSNILSSEITEDNYVVVSRNSRPAVATGFVTQISATKINILLDRNLQQKYPNEFFHIDTYESNITFNFNMTSLSLLLENNPRAAELRSIIIDKKAPTFLSKLPSVVAKKGATILKRLNVVQQKAVLKALCAKDFFLIEGMPGTGKSATIVALIQLLVELDKNVLLTSHTHSAIDNICLRLQKREVDFLRLGSGSKIDAGLKANSETTLLKDCTTPEQMEDIYSRYKVTAVTCLACSHPLLSKRTFDVCIVDESTQVLQTSVIRALRAAKTFILIGDPHQLTPVVKSRTASEAGMSETLFERLQNSQGMIALNLNYRMNQTITDLANVLTYGGELKTATEEVAGRTLHIPEIERVRAQYEAHPWLLKSLDTSLQSAIQLIDTGPVWQESQDIKWPLKKHKFSELDSQNCINVHEAAIVVTLVKALICGGVPNTDIGIIATYRAQVSRISDFLDELDIEVSTIDQFQGRDKNVIIYSCTKSMDPGRSSESLKNELLENKRRLTVALTRAKRKLVIVGDMSTLERLSTFSLILPSLKKNIIKFDSSWSLMNNF